MCPATLGTLRLSYAFKASSRLFCLHIWFATSQPSTKATSRTVLGSVRLTMLWKGSGRSQSVIWAKASPQFAVGPVCGYEEIAVLFTLSGGISANHAHPEATIQKLGGRNALRSPMENTLVTQIERMVEDLAHIVSSNLIPGTGFLRKEPAPSSSNPTS
ncbi:hypothetical protein Trco_002417 [Trichoderma cornu-damae]|uniref:Uncharacterized protein n=1 Tax=Trichoderma cornu-damae TaxID=654480 RepID=A0A9P8QML4_9HYPO|nr:hypothetical protein Trco_002417 [Trichoderma cornu-damae]